MTANTDKAIEALLLAGFEPAGMTPVERVKFCVSTGHGMGFKGATFGGRLRFAKGERRCTVGKRTVCFYRIYVNGPADFENVKTSDTAAITRLAALET